MIESKIKELRKSLKWSQKKLSEELEIPKRTLEDWENNRRTPPIYVENLIIEKLERILEESIMTNEKITEIMEEAVRASYASQSDETLEQLGSVDDAVKSAIDGIDFSEADGMTDKELYDFYYDWTIDGIRSVL